MNNYSPVQLTSAGGTLDPYVGFGQVQNLLMYSSGSLTMAANFSISPTTTFLGTAILRVRWNAVISNLNGFLVVICGKTISADQLNQPGTFECFWDGTAWTVFYYADGTSQPQNAQNVELVNVLAAGGTLTLTAGSSAQYQVVSGAAVTLLSSYTITAGTSGVKKNSRFYIELAGGITLGGNTMTVFGITINAGQALNGGVLVIATFDGTAWRGIITSKTLALSDFPQIAGYSILANTTSSTGLMSVLTLTAGQIIKHNGSAIVAGKIGFDNLESDLIALGLAEVNIGAAQVAQSNTTPVLVKAAPGASSIDFPLAMIVSCTFNGVAYTTNLNGSLWQSSAAQPAITKTGLLGFTSSMFQAAMWLPIGSAATQIVTNQPTYYRTETSDPLAGDGSIAVKMLYAKLKA